MLPRAWRPRVAREHLRRRSECLRDANAWLLDLTERAGAIRVPVNIGDAELCDLAAHCARDAMMVAFRIGAQGSDVLRAAMGRYVACYGIEPPPARRKTRKGAWVGVEDGPAIARMADSQWWRRGLRRAQGRGIEREAIGLGYVHRQAEIYCSDLTAERRRQQRARNAAMLEGTEAINRDTGEIYRLDELVAKSVANPTIRRGELMTRIRGFEEMAIGLGHVAEFVTLTCPSKYHAMRSGARGAPEVNPKYAGATPREAQGYLGKLWQAIRAKLARMAIRVYGFRIAEPHHDGCPHWHLLLFLDPVREAVKRFREVLTAYALREDGDEAGARDNRIKFVSIDPAKGSAAGYVAKYVAKNIDGYQVQKDLEGCDAVTSSMRVDAWASTWGIRQFQQVGGPPVGVWRELRRMDAQEGAAPVLEEARSAADAGNWRRYVEVMGGPTVARADLPLRTAYTRAGERWNFQAGQPEPAPRTRYGEEARPVVFGIGIGGRAWASRRYRWELKRRASGVGVSWTRVNNCTEGSDGSGNGVAECSAGIASGGRQGQSDCTGSGQGGTQADLAGAAGAVGPGGGGG